MYKTKLPLVCKYFWDGKIKEINNIYQSWNSVPDVTDEEERRIVANMHMDAEVAIHFLPIASAEPDVYYDVLLSIDRSEDKASIVEAARESIKFYSDHAIDARIVEIYEYYLRCKKILFMTIVELYASGIGDTDNLGSAKAGDRVDDAKLLYESYERFVDQTERMIDKRLFEGLPRKLKNILRAAMVEFLDNDDTLDMPLLKEVYEVLGYGSLVPSLEGEISLYFLDDPNVSKVIPKTILEILSKEKYVSNKGEDITDKIRDRLVQASLDYEVDEEFKELLGVTDGGCIIS